DLARVSAGREPATVRSLTAAALDQVDVGQGQPPPRLESVLEWAERHSMLLNIELKTAAARRDGIAEAVARLLEEHPRAAVIVSSFHPLLLRRFKRASPGTPTAWLFTAEHVSWARLARALEVDAVHPDARCFLDSRPWPRPSGMLVNTWTVNDPEQAHLLAARGVDAIITDMPGTILRALSPSLLDQALAENVEDLAEGIEDVAEIAET